MMNCATFAAIFAALYAAHQVADYWLQTRAQAFTKGGQGEHNRAGQLADLRHVASITATKITAVALVWLAVGISVTPWLAPALAVDAASHYWADRRFTLERLADRMGKLFGKGDQYRAGGAPHLDQAWHIAWLFAAALIAAH